MIALKMLKIVYFGLKILEIFQRRGLCRFAPAPLAVIVAN